MKLEYKFTKDDLQNLQAILKDAKIHGCDDGAYGEELNDLRWDIIITIDEMLKY